MWSIGVVMYILLSGYMPFQGKDFDEILETLAGASIYKSRETMMIEELGEENYKLLKKSKVLQNRKGVQMLLPFDLNF